jgi:TPR repeat protein
MNRTKFSPLLATPGRHAPSQTNDALQNNRRPRPGGRGLGATFAAALLVAFLLNSGHAPSDAQEIAWLNRLASAGNPDAQLQLGLAYREGRHGLVPDAAIGRYWLQKAAGNGQRYAADMLAGQPAAGSAGTAGTARAPDHNRLDDLAAELDSPPLVTASALWKILGLGLTGGQSPTALQARAQAGDARAEYQLAMRYRDGAWSVNRDPARALYWLQHAAGDGNLLAMQSLSEVYRTGSLGAERDLDKAAQWQERAAAAAGPHG